jgi:hypothetical protein
LTGKFSGGAHNKECATCPHGQTADRPLSATKCAVTAGSLTALLLSVAGQPAGRTESAVNGTGGTVTSRAASAIGSLPESRAPSRSPRESLLRAVDAPSSAPSSTPSSAPSVAPTASPTKNTANSSAPTALPTALPTAFPATAKCATGRFRDRKVGFGLGHSSDRPLACATALHASDLLASAGLDLKGWTGGRGGAAETAPAPRPSAAAARGALLPLPRPLPAHPSPRRPAARSPPARHNGGGGSPPDRPSSTQRHDRGEGSPIALPLSLTPP